MDNIPDRPLDPPDVQDVYICEDCGNEYPDDSWCKECYAFPPSFTIDTKVDEHDMAFVNWCMKEGYPTDLPLLKLAFLAGTDHGLDVAIRIMKK